MTEDMLMHRIRAHRSAPDVYDPPTFEVMAQRIEELEAKLAQQDDLVQAANRLAEYLNGDHIYMERVHHLAAAIRKGGE